jgi:hypothetical protein
MPIPRICLTGRDQNLRNFCPFCGVENATNAGDVEACKHLLFIYLNIADELIYVRDGLFGSLSKEEIFESMFELLEKLEIKDAFILEEYVPVAGSQYLIGYQILDED